MTREVGPARGILHPHLPQGEFRHERRAPAAALSGVVQHLWHVAWDLTGLPAQQQETLPHPNVHLVIERGQTRIHGIHGARFTRRLEGRGCVFGVKFRSGGFHPFFKAPVSALMDRSVSVEEVFGDDAATLEDEVLACADTASMAAVAERFLLRHLPPPDPVHFIRDFRRLVGVAPGAYWRAEGGSVEPPSPPQRARRRPAP